MTDNIFDKAVADALAANPPPTSAVLDAAVDEAVGQQVRSAVQAASNLSPDTRAKAMRIGRDMRLPTDMVERNIDELSAISDADKIAGDLLANPRLRAWFAQPDNAAVAVDSVTQMLDVGRSFLAAPLSTVGSGIAGQGAMGGVVERLDNRGRGPEMTPQALEGFRAMGWSPVPQIPITPTELLGGGLGARLPRMQFDPAWTIPGADWAFPDLTLPDETAIAVGDALKRAADWVGPPPERQNLATDIAGGIGQLGTQIAVTLLRPELGVAMLIGQGADQQAGQAREAGAYGTPEGDAAILLGAGVTGLSEKLGLDFLLNRVPPQIKSRVLRWLTDAAIGGGIEAAQEAVEQVGHNLVAYALYDPDHPLFDGLKRQAEAAGGAGGIVRLLINALLPGRQHASQDRQAAGAEPRRDQMVSARDAADTAPLAARAPEAMEDAIRAMTGGDKTVSIPISAATELNQSPADLGELLGVQDQVAEALATGGDLVVPIERLFTIPRERFDALADHFRVNEGMTVAESRALGQDRQDAIDDIAERAAIETEGVSSSEAVTRHVFGRLITAGQAPEAARRNAAFMAQRYSTRAERRGLGEDPYALMLADQLDIIGPLPPVVRDLVRTPDALGRALDELRQGDKKPGKIETPVLDIIRRLGGVARGSNLAGELEAIGITPSTQRGLFKRKGGLGDVDNLVWSEDPIWQDNTQPDENGYVPRQAVLDALAREAGGAPLRAGSDLAARNEAAAQREELEALLDRARVDIKTATNDQIRQALAAVERDAQPTPGALEQAQREGLAKDIDIWRGKLRDLIRGKLPDTADLRVGAVPPVLRAVGVRPGQMVFRASKIRKVIADHPDIGGSSLLDLPSLLADPDLIYEESAGSKSSDLVVVTKNKSKNGSPVVAAIKAEGTSNKTDPATIVLTVYPLDRSGQKIAEVIASGRLRYERDGQTSAGYEHTGANSLNGLPKQSPGPRPAHAQKVITAADVVKVYRKLYQGAAGIDLTPGGAQQFRSGATTIDYGVSRDGQTVEISLVRTARESRGRGSARRAMSQLLVAFDRAGMTAFLTPEAMDQGVSKSKLTSFYRSLGFRDNGGRSKDFRSRATMVREPRGPLSQMAAGGGPRGSFARETLADGTSRNIIRLTEAADLSTFLHEGGHFFLFQLVDDAYDRQVPQNNRAQMLADLQSFLDWQGIDVKAADLDADEIHALLTIEHHEQFARGFEAYLMEGRAPSVGLRDLFRRFAAWLTMIYRSAAGLRARLNPEIRRVMDRLLASDEEIAQAESDMAFTPLDAKRLGMTDAEAGRYAQAVTKARDEAREKLTRDLMDEIKRERTKWWGEEEGRVREQVTDEVRRRPVYTALLALQRGENPAGEKMATHFRLDRDVLIEAYGHQWVKDYLLPLRIYSIKDGLDPDLAAGMFGFDSADAMVQAMVNATPMAEAIKAETDAEMVRRHGDLLSDGSIADAAVAAVEGDAQSRLLAMEIRALKRAGLKELTGSAERNVQDRGAGTAAQDRAGVAEADALIDEAVNVGAGTDAAAPAIAGAQAAEANARASVGQRRAQAAALSQVRGMQAALDVDALKQAAARAIRGKKVNDAISPARYEATAARHGQKAERAIAARRYGDAAIAKEQQLLNLFLAREAREARDKVERITDRMERFVDPKAKWTNIDEDYIDHIRQLLDAYQFGARLSDRRRAQLQLEAFYAWAQKQQEGDGDAAIEVPPEILAADNLVHYRDMELERLYALADAVENVFSVGRARREWEIGEERRDLSQMVTDGVALIRANVKERPRPALADDAKWTARTRQTLSGFGSMLIKARTWIEEMDGFKQGGWWSRHVLTPIREAEVARLHRLRAEADAFGKIIEKHYGAALTGRPRDWGRAIFINETVGSMRKDQIVAVALNWGNEDGRQRLLDQKARRWTQGDIDLMFEHMEPRDWAFVQDVWDYLNSFWPEISALEKKRKGFTPEKVEALPFTVRGEGGRPLALRGGYYPLKYDSASSTRASENDIEAAFKGMQAGRFASAQTRRGHTKERMASAGGMSLNLDLSAIRDHVDQVVTDLVMWQPIRSTWKLLTHYSTKQAIEETFGVEVNRQLDLWIKDVAVGKLQAGDAWSRIWGGLRLSASTAAMGWKVSTTLVQVTGYVQTVAELGPRWAAVGLSKFVTSPLASIETVERLSPFMRERAQAFQRDMLDAVEKMRGRGVLSTLQATLFWPIVKMQRFVDIPTWIGAYNRGLAEGRTDEDAARLADDFVESAQGGGLMSTLSALERGTVSQNVRLSEFVKLWSFMYSYYNTKLNVAVRKARGTNFRDAGQVAKLASDYLLLFWVEAVLGNAILGQWPGDDDDDEWGALKWTVGVASQQLMSTVPGLRDVSSVVSGFTPQTPAERSMNVLGDALIELGKAGSAVADGDAPNWWTLAKRIIDAGNVLSPIKYPAGQIKQIITGMERSAKGTGDWIDYLAWRPEQPRR